MRKKRKTHRIRSNIPKKRKPKRVVKNPRVPRTRNLGTLTEAQYFQKIRTALRRVFRFWKPAYKVLENSSRPYTGSNKLQKREYQCNICKKWWKRTEVEIDHIISCGSLNTYNDIVPFIQRLTTEELDGFQTVCKPCHKKKTKEYLLTKKI